MAAYSESNRLGLSTISLPFEPIVFLFCGKVKEKQKNIFLLSLHTNFCFKADWSQGIHVGGGFGRTIYMKDPRNESNYTLNTTLL